MGRRIGSLGVLVGFGVAFCSLVTALQATAEALGIGMMDFETARDRFFNGADADGDFALSSEEQLSAVRALSAMDVGLAWIRSPVVFECQDSDGDGMCTYPEFLDSGSTVFDELDRNRDGRLMPDEVQ